MHLRNPQGCRNHVSCLILFAISDLIAVFNTRKLSEIMTSGLEVINTIAGVMGTSLKLSLTLSQIADDIGSAGKDVRTISGEMASLCRYKPTILSSTG